MHERNGSVSRCFALCVTSTAAADQQLADASARIKILLNSEGNVGGVTSGVVCGVLILIKGRSSAGGSHIGSGEGKNRGKPPLAESTERLLRIRDLMTQ